MKALARHLAVLSYANGFTHWLYKMPREHAPTKLEDPSYWQEVREMLSAGDQILVSNPIYNSSLAVLEDEEKGLAFKILSAAADGLAFRPRRNTRAKVQANDIPSVWFITAQERQRCRDILFAMLENGELADCHPTYVLRKAIEAFDALPGEPKA